VSIIGGHTVDDIEPKYGLAVTGVVHPDRVVRNSTAQPGDLLVLTKPLGTGIISTAVKRGLADEAAAKQAAEMMATLNHRAAETMLEVGANACTDITGFGLLGHLREMAVGSGVNVTLHADAVPVLPAARTFAAADIVPGGTLNNLAFVEKQVTFAPGVSRVQQLILADAQTSGGLLISLPATNTERLLSSLQAAGVVDAAAIGQVTDRGTGRIVVEQ
jgi:selenide,water dikinase